MNVSSPCARLFLLAVLCISSVIAAAQSKPKAATSTKSTSSSSSGGSSAGGHSAGGGGAAGGSAAGGTAADTSIGPFSIETEMFTYKAVQENSEVIACDIARYLFQGEVVEAPVGSHAPCAISNAAQSTPGILIVSSDSSLMSDFQLWRADMATMSALEARATNVCVAEAKNENGEPAPAQPPHMKSRGLGGAVAGLAQITPQGQAIGAALALFSSSQTVNSVVGTVENPALINEVARELRSLNVQVLVPELYNPGSLGPADYSDSPYLQNLENFNTAYEKCAKVKAGYAENAPEAASIDSLIGSMDGFLKGVMAGPAPAASADDQADATNASSHFAAIFTADEVAKQMGFTGNGASGASPTWQHVLWLKALESGGSVDRQSNLFGTKVTFGGGAVDTYSVFRLNGRLVCSGNVYNFQSPVRTKDLQKTFRAMPIDNPAHPSILRSTCALLPSS
jgi:hypothetical protein